MTRASGGHGDRQPVAPPPQSADRPTPSERLTLEAIGVRVNLTDERVRQVLRPILPEKQYNPIARKAR